MGQPPVHVGALPAQCAALNSLTAQIEEMAVEAALTGNPRLVFHAICHDPLTAAVLSLAEIRQMVNQMFHQNRDYLGYFKSLTV
jgi:alpha-galactosidase